MSREVQLKRLLEIDRLIRAGRAPSPQMLAERLGVKTRQIYLDRRQLIEHFGAPLVLDRVRDGWVCTGQHAEALAPPELRALVRDHVRQMATLYEENSND